MRGLPGFEKTTKTVLSINQVKLLFRFRLVAYMVLMGAMLVYEKHNDTLKGKIHKSYERIEDTFDLIKSYFVTPPEIGFPCTSFAMDVSDKLVYLTCGYIDKTGKVVVPAQFDEVGCIFEGMINVKKNDKWGFIRIKN